MLTNIIVAMCLLTIVHCTHYNPKVVVAVLTVTSIIAVEWVKEKNNWRR